MRNTLAIAGREVRSYFSSPVAYVLLAAFLALAGYFFYALLTAFNQALALYTMTSLTRTTLGSTPVARTRTVRSRSVTMPTGCSASMTTSVPT